MSLTLPLLAGTCRSPIPNLRAPATAPRQDFPGNLLIMLAQGRDFEAERLKCLLRLVHAALSGRFQTGPVHRPTDSHWLPLDPADVEIVQGNGRSAVTALFAEVSLL